MTDEIVSFGDREALWAWLVRNHASHAGVWVRLGKRRGRLVSITFDDLLEAGLAFGWSESARRSCDADSYLQHFTPRRSTGTASERNLRIAARLEREGRMTDAGRAALGSARPS